jgi:hypothetical protein
LGAFTPRAVRVESASRTAAVGDSVAYLGAYLGDGNQAGLWGSILPAV